MFVLSPIDIPINYLFNSIIVFISTYHKCNISQTRRYIRISTHSSISTRITKIFYLMRNLWRDSTAFR